MAVNFIEKKKKQKYLVFIVLGIAGVTLIILWFGYFNKPVADPTPEEKDIVKKNININYSILGSPFLKALILFQETPLYEGEIGKDNPFLKQ